MKTFKISYDGYASRFKGLNAIVEAESEREAVESFYASKLPDNYFPDENGDVYDSEGDWVAESGDTYFCYDGGYFRATEVDADFQETFEAKDSFKTLSDLPYCVITKID